MDEVSSDMKRRVENVSLIACLLYYTFGVFTHFYAYLKCEYGIGAFRVINEETERSYAIWSFVDGNQWIFICLPLVVLSVYLSMRIFNLRYRIRLSALGLFALLVVWYSWKCAYLGGKFLSY